MARRPTLTQSPVDLDMEAEGPSQVGSASSLAGDDTERPMSRKASGGSGRKHVTISDDTSTLQYDPDKPSSTPPQPPPKPVVSYKPSRRSEVWDNRGEVVDSSDEEHPQNRGMQPFEVERGRTGGGGGDRCSDKCDRCTDRCTDQCVTM
mmetsp:Transcript_107282/g.149571  ORF Transcript_107282/g.149571 Transcript_107282/m.149571 type:complete len:149 (-) Transcript_107282:31-477(-)